MTRWSFALSGGILLVCVFFLAGSAWLCYTNWDRNSRRKRIGLLEALRLVLITLLTLTLLRPELVQQLERKEKPEIAVLLDSSPSMETRDIAVSNKVVTRAEWLRQQRQKKIWAGLEKRAKVSVEEFSAPPENTNARPELAGTDLNAALETALQRHRALKAVFLLTDGDWNAGQSPLNAATQYREQSIPIFSVAIGRESPLPDLVLEEVSAPAYGLFGEEISIPFKITSHLSREVKTTVTLWNGRAEEARKEVIIPAQGELHDILLWSPTAVGETSLTLKVPVESEEAFADNNQRQFQINIRVETLKVLIVDSLPRWEYRYLRNALERDPGVEMNCILFHPGLGPGGGRRYLPRFPNTKEEISKYDVIFLGDVGIGENELTEDQTALVKGLVEQQSSGLVFLPGRRGREITFLKSALKDLLPVQFDESKLAGVEMRNESELFLTSLGKGHWLTRFDAEEQRNAEIWKNLPGFSWSAAVEKSRPGSEVLAVHSDLRNSWGRIPLLVTRGYGSGNVLFMGTDSAWRWRRGVEDKYHYRFWSQVVRWMAHQRHLSEKEGIRLTYSPETPQSSETIFLQATLLDAAGYPAQNASLAGRIISPSGRAERLEFSELEGGWGVFKSKFVPQESGPYQIYIGSQNAGRHLDSKILVSAPQREKLGQPVNSAVLQELARVSGGASGRYDSVAQVIDQISTLPNPRPMEKRIRLWCDPIWGGCLLGLLGIYWTGRKLAGMV